MDGISEGSEYAEHITEGDLRLLATVMQSTPVPEALPRMLADPRVFAAIFGPRATASREAVLASPFLAFAVAVHRAVADLATVGYVTERSIATRAFGPVSAARLLRAAHVPAPERERLAAAPDIELLEDLGARWYRSAFALAPVRTSRLAVVAEVADRFRQARRVLNHVADRYLMGPDNPWLIAPGR